MQIVQLTKVPDPINPVALVTLEMPIIELVKHLDAGDEAVERFVGREFLTALHKFVQAERSVEDAEEKEQENESTAVPQES
jgi:hypothetical protein